MAETANTASLGNKVSEDIFKWLKWQFKTAKDVNFPCETETHGKETHPVDVVFHYKNPYNDKIVYVNTDLKSYTEVSINANSTRNALKSLSMTIECASISERWQTFFCHSDNFMISGLLFIYNYDETFKDDFYNKILKTTSLDSLDIPTGQMLAVFEPKVVHYLLNVAEDLSKQVMKRKAFDASVYDFYYPNHITARKHHLDEYAATLECILSPYMIVKFKSPNYQNDYLVYYQESGNTVDEFIYLIDTLASFQLLEEENNISIILNSVESEDCLVNFTNAKARYAEVWGMKEDDVIFQKIKAEILPNKHHVYNPMNTRIENEQG